MKHTASITKRPGISQDPAFAQAGKFDLSTLLFPGLFLKKPQTI